MVGFAGFLVLALGGGAAALFFGIPPLWIGAYIIGLLVIGAIFGFGSPEDGGSGGGGGSPSRSGGGSRGSSGGGLGDTVNSVFDGLSGSSGSSSDSDDRGSRYPGSLRDRIVGDSGNSPGSGDPSDPGSGPSGGSPGGGSPTDPGSGPGGSSPNGGGPTGGGSPGSNPSGGPSPGSDSSPDNNNINNTTENGSMGDPVENTAKEIMSDLQEEEELEGREHEIVQKAETRLKDFLRKYERDKEAINILEQGVNGNASNAEVMSKIEELDIRGGGNAQQKYVQLRQDFEDMKEDLEGVMEAMEEVEELEVREERDTEESESDAKSILQEEHFDKLEAAIQQLSK